MRTTNTRVYLIVATLLLFALALLLRGSWLPLLPQQIELIRSIANFIEEHSGFLEGISVIASAILFVWNTIKNRLSNASILSEDDLLHPTKTHELRASLGQWGGQVKWIDRGSITIEDLRRDRKVALLGIMKVGKTREAIELISKAVESDLILDSSIFTPGLSIGRGSKSSIEQYLKERFHGKSSVLIFVDDLPHYFNGDYLDDLGEILKIAEEICPRLLLVVTIRIDQWNDSHRAWLSTHQVAQHKVRPFNRTQTKTLLKNALTTFQIDADSEAIQAFIDNSDGTPEHVLSALRQLHVKRTDRITATIATMQAVKETKMIWYDNRHIIEGEHPLGREIIRVLSMFHSSGLKPHIHLVQAISAFNWLQQRRWFEIFSIKKQLQSALTYLMNFDVVAGSRTIVAPDMALEPMSILYAQTNFAKWLLRQDKVWRKLLLKYFFKALEEYYAALLTLERIGRQHPDYDREIYSRLKARKDAFLNKIVSEMEKHIQPSIPSPQEVWDDIREYFERRMVVRNDLQKTYDMSLDPAVAWCVQGFRNLESGDKADALRAFRIAIRASPDNPVAHYGMGLLYWGWGQTREALQECSQAIELNPKFAIGHHSLGYMQLATSELDDAVASFEKSLELNPDFTPSIVGLARVLLLREQPEKALSLLETTYQRLPADNNVSMLMSWLKIMMSESSIEEKEGEALQLLLAYLPEVTEVMIRTKISDLEIALRDAKIIVAYLLKEEVDDFELIDLFTFIAELNVVENKLNKALSVLRKATELSPTFIEVYILLGNTYQISDSPNAAIEIYKQVVSLNPRVIEAYIGLAKVHLLSEKIDEAIEISFRALEIDPYSLDAHILLAACYQRLGYRGKFEEQIEIVANLEDLDAFGRARIEALNGNQEKAIELLDAAFHQDLMLMPMVLTDPCFANLKEHPSLRDLLETHRYNVATRRSRTSIS